MSKFDRKCDKEFLLGYATNTKAYRVYNKNHCTVEEVHDVEFDEINGLQIEQKNIDDVRGTNLESVMKNMSIVDVRPRQVEEDDDDSIRVIPPTSKARSSST